jgi:phage tail tape-measure protein
MLKRTIAITAACAMLALFAGCSGTGGIHKETLLDQNWGRSVETAKYNQILNPDAGKDLTPVEGLSGKAAGITVEKYENSFKKETKQEAATTTTIMK